MRSAKSKIFSSDRKNVKNRFIQARDEGSSLASGINKMFTSISDLACDHEIEIEEKETIDAKDKLRLLACKRKSDFDWSNWNRSDVIKRYLNLGNCYSELIDFKSSD